MWDNLVTLVLVRGGARRRLRRKRDSRDILEMHNVIGIVSPDNSLRMILLVCAFYADDINWQDNLAQPFRVAEEAS